MANFLTGDFDAVFQISRGTINRLLATMHQNNWEDNWTPSLPHVVTLRLGDVQAIDGVVGTVEAQLGAPQIELRHGSTDRFGLRLGVRARYLPDPDTEPLAEFINGTLSVDYVLGPPPPSWPGWSGAAASDYLTATVVEDSVSIDGSVAYGWEHSFFADPGYVLPLVARQIAHLLSASFPATPIQIGSTVRPDALRSLSAAGGSAVAGAVDVGSGTDGQAASIETEWLEGRDIGVAVSADHVLSAVEPVLEYLRALQLSVPVDVEVFDTVYRVRVSAATAAWTGLGDRAAIGVHVSGSARTDAALLPDAEFQVDQTIDLTFDAGSEALNLAAGARTVAVQVGGPFGDAAAPVVRNALDARIGAQVGALVGASPSVDLKAARHRLRAALGTLDRNLTVRLEDCVFRSEGLVVRGRVGVSPRKAPVLTFVPTADSLEFTALDSWIPGGQVIDLHWTWQRPLGPGEEPPSEAESSARYADRFLLRGPLVYDASGIRYHASLPGLEGRGGVILSTGAVAVDERSGELVPIEVLAKAIGFQYRFPWELPDWIDDIYVVTEHMTPRGGPRPQEPSRGVVTKATRPPGRPSANTLIVTQGGGITTETLATLDAYLAGDHPRRGGLLTVALLGEGESSKLGDDVRSELGRLEARVTDTPVVVAEAVDSTFSDALMLPTDTAEPSYRLISPRGGVTWTHDGPLTGTELAAALEATLMPGPPPVPEAVSDGPEPGASLWEKLGSGITGPDGGRYPAPPLGRHADGPTLAVFAHARSVASAEQLRNVEQRRAPDAGAGARVCVFVAGGSDDVRALGSELGDGVDVVPDPSGAMAERLGVSCWPTTVLLDERGAVVESWVGADAAALDERGFGRSER